MVALGLDKDDRDKIDYDFQKGWVQHSKVKSSLYDDFVARTGEFKMPDTPITTKIDDQDTDTSVRSDGTEVN